LVAVVSTPAAIVSTEVESVATEVESVAVAVDSAVFPPQEAKAKVAMNAKAIITFFIIVIFKLIRVVICKLEFGCFGVLISFLK
jgi:hypothetical protein